MKRILALFLVLVMAVSLIACTQKEEIHEEETQPVTVTPTEPVKKTIHVLLPATGEGWEDAVAAQTMTAVDVLQAAGNYEIVTANYESAEQQSQLLADIAAQSDKAGNAGVVTMPLDREMDGAFAQLLEANVAYALADIIPAGAEAASVTNVQYDQYQIGAAAAAYLTAKGLTQDNRVVIIQGITEEEAQRTEGFKLYLQGKIEVDGTVIEDSWTTLENIVYSEMQGTTQESVESYFESFLNESDHADTKYIAAWDDVYVLGVLEALEGENIDSDNKEEFLEGAPFITGCGGSQAMFAVLAGTSEYSSAASFGGIQTVLYSQDLLKTALESMVSYFDGNVVEQDQTQPVIWVSAENVSQYQGYSSAQVLPAEEPTTEATTAGE